MPSSQSVTEKDAAGAVAAHWWRTPWKAMADLAEAVDDLICSFDYMDTAMDNLVMLIFIWILFSIVLLGIAKWAYARFANKVVEVDPKQKPSTADETKKTSNEIINSADSVLATSAKVKSASFKPAKPTGFVPATPPNKRRLGRMSPGPEQLTLKKHQSVLVPTCLGSDPPSVQWVNDLLTWLYNDLVIVNELVQQWIVSMNEFSKKSVEEVTDPDDVPAFVAKDLHKLPPVTFDHVDVTRLLKDITFLKASLAELQSKLEASDNTIGELRAEVVLLRKAASVSRTPDASNVNTRRGAQNASFGSFESAKFDASPAANIVCDASCPVAAVPASTPAEVTTCVGALTPKRAYAAIVAANKPAVSQVKRHEVKGGKQRRCDTTCKDLAQRKTEQDTCDKDGFIKVQRKKRKPACRNQCGTAPSGPNFLLRPAVPMTPLYVSRLHHSTKVAEIVEYISIKTKFTLRVERLESHHGVSFNSFVVRVPTQHLSTFMKEEFWPRGVVFRRFRGRIPDTARHTTPTLRVN